MANLVVENHLRAPATAIFRSAVIDERGPDGWLRATVVVDSQNGFGALIRSHYHVIFRRTGADTVTWVKFGFAVSEVTEFETESNIEAWKTQNGWPRQCPPENADQVASVGGLSAADIRGALAPHLVEVRACLPKKIKAHQHFAIAGIVSGYGDLQGVDVTGLAERQADCIKDLARRWWFPKRRPASCIRVPFDLPAGQ